MSPSTAAEIDKILVAVDIHIRGDPAFDSRDPLNFFMPLKYLASTGYLDDTLM
eukprot:gene17543-12551_t